MSIKTWALFLAFLTALAMHMPQAEAREYFAVPDTCDPFVNDIMRARGWMEAQREIEVSQNLITRPQSVLDLACSEKMFMKAQELGDFSFVGKPNDMATAFITIADLACASMKEVSKAARCTDVGQDRVIVDLAKLAMGDFRGPACSLDETKMALRHNLWTGADKLAEMEYHKASRPPKAGGSDEVKSWDEKSDGSKCEDSAFVETNMTYNYTVIENGKKVPKTGKSGTCLARGCYFNGQKCVPLEN